MSDLKKLAKKLTQAIVLSEATIEKGITLAAIDVEASVKQRVFGKGKDARGNSIGEYSTRPFYLNLAGHQGATGSQVKNTRIKGRGQTSNRQKFKNQNARKGRFLAGGYAQYRREVGRQSEYVDLYLTGGLSQSINTGIRTRRATVAIMTDKYQERAAKLEDKYGKDIFVASKAEHDRAMKIMDSVLIDAIDNILKL